MIAGEFYNKAIRTAIWKAFAEWVSSWNKPKIWELYEFGTQEEKIAIFEEIQRLHKTMRWNPPVSKT